MFYNSSKNLINCGICSCFNFEKNNLYKSNKGLFCQKIVTFFAFLIYIALENICPEFWPSPECPDFDWNFGVIYL